MTHEEQLANELLDPDEVAEILRDIAKRVGGLLWDSADKAERGGDDGPAGVLVPAK